MSHDAIRGLKHVTRSLPNDGMVLVLNPGAIIGPEAEAMIQALHSRSAEGVRSHLEILAQKGPEKFMASFYVGYGHKSIGDCGTATIFIEGVSMLVAKAIQDWPLYSGQESSTRYIDFSSQRFHDPIGSENSKEILEQWRSFYVEAQGELKDHLRVRFPRNETEDEKVYEKAIAARAFDILRGFLPAGATTNLAWHTNLRQAADKLMLLRHHPLEEVQVVAGAIEDALKEAYPSSFGHKQYPETEDYNAAFMDGEYLYHDPQKRALECSWDGINHMELRRWRRWLETRPPKTELPKQLGSCGSLQFKFMLDFGSFRDIQRHRAVCQRMPLLTFDLEFETWYLSELSDALRLKALVLLEKQKAEIRKLEKAVTLSHSELQYYIPMGYRTSNEVTGNLSALVYLVELRATRFVHPTLRENAVLMAHFLEQQYGHAGLKLHLDEDPGRFDIRRGEHDIVLKN
ncbi:MAG: FAD-dependent thymidylate synthase [Candidatus Yonathbacteria bacterium]|nr:FAD-dependent thymidylate synthase [Candidatus Yonathbacteria bacterium]